MSVLLNFAEYVHNDVCVYLFDFGKHVPNGVSVYHGYNCSSWKAESCFKKKKKMFL